MPSNIRSNHGPHTQFLRGEVSCQSTHVESCNCTLEHSWDLVAMVCAQCLSLRIETRNDPRQRIACTSGAKSRVSRRINENSSVWSGNQGARALQDDEDFVFSCELLLRSSPICQGSFVTCSDQPPHLSRMRRKH